MSRTTTIGVAILSFAMGTIGIVVVIKYPVSFWYLMFECLAFSCAFCNMIFQTVLVVEEMLDEDAMQEESQA